MLERGVDFIVKKIKEKGDQYNLGIFVPEEHGLSWPEIKIYSKIRDENSSYKCSYEYTFPFLDLYKCPSSDGNLHVDLYPGVFKFEKNSIFPMRRAKFENITMLIPRNPIPFLDHYYPDWETCIKTHGWDHRNKVPIESKTLSITKNIKILDRHQWKQRNK